MPHPSYKTREETIRLDEVEVRILRVTNIDELFDELVAKGKDSLEVKDERIPYWADLWPSAIALSKYLVQHRMIRSGMKILEIGCGLGLPGVVAAKLGAKVTFSDYVEEPLEFAKHNCMLNEISNASFMLADWRNMPDEIDAEIVLASDVAYERRSFEHLSSLIGDMTAKGKTVLLSEPGRKFAEPFILELEQKKLVERSQLFTIPLNGLENKVRVFELRKS